MCDVIGGRRVYQRSQLLVLYTHHRPTVAVELCLRSAGLWSPCRLYSASNCKTVTSPSCRVGRVYIGACRGRRSGRSRRPTPVLRSAGNGVAIITGNRSPPRVVLSPPRPPPALLKVHVDRHSASASKQLVCGCLNVRSLANKVDDLLDVRRDHQIDVLFLVETWHDSDSVSIRRLRADGFQVVDRPRPRCRTDTLDTNHGGVAAIAVPGVRLQRVTSASNRLRLN